MDFTALTLASSRDYTDIMKLLLNAGADTEVVDKMVGNSSVIGQRFLLTIKSCTVSSHL